VRGSCLRHTLPVVFGSISHQPLKVVPGGPCNLTCQNTELLTYYRTNMLLTFIAVKGQCSSCPLRWGGAKEDEDVTVKGHTAWKDTTTNGGNRWRTRQFPHAKSCNPSARTNIQVNTHIVIAARLRHVSPRSCCGVHEDQPRESTSSYTRVPGQFGAPRAHDSGRDCPGPGNGASLRIATTPAPVADGSRNAAIPETGISTLPLRLRLRFQRN
jgi:hypothetical protein